MEKTISLSSEWAEQDAVLMAWPHKGTDWNNILDEVQECYSQIINIITRFDETIILLVPDEENRKFVTEKFGNKVYPLIIPVNDTWARDFGPLFVKKGTYFICNDFKFNGWGLKFAADKDNLVTGLMSCHNIFSEEASYQNRLNFVLEGGSIESDGEGTLLTTAECLLSPNRNGEWNRLEIEEYLKSTFGLKRVLWLNNGALQGDDTDSHIDTLARFCDRETIVYVKCENKRDVHFEQLSYMEEELKSFRTIEGKPYRLIPLPMPEPIYFEEERLPATYANFLIINKAVLVPTYSSIYDKDAIDALSSLYPDKTVIGVDCSALIKQHGSLHCITMQLPAGTINHKILFR